MATVDDTQSPYNNTFDADKAYEKLLFSPNRPLFQSELNEMQSIMQYQQKMLGDTVFKDGSIISGMTLDITKSTSTDTSIDTATTTQKANLILLSTLTAYNSRIDTSSYMQNGTVSIESKGTQDRDYPGMTFTVTGAQAGSIALRFKVKRTSGVLYKLSGIFDSTHLTVTSYRVDGKTIKTDFSDMSTAGVIDSSGNQINISDGNDHEVLLVLKADAEGSYPITIVANSGYNALTDGVVNFDFSELKAEAGTTSTAWTLAPSDVGSSNIGSRNTKVSVSSGQVYLNGMIRTFQPQSINITGVGSESLGIRLDQDVITANEDSTLYDHTVGAPSQWQKGADRLHYTVTLTYNDTTATTIFKLQDGKLEQESAKPDMTSLNEVLAKRTNDESGSYRVNGFSLWSEENQTDSSKVNLVIDSGTAYVQGYQIYKPSPIRIPIDKATEVSEAGNETFYYSSANEDNGILDNQPVKNIQRVTGSIQATEAINRSTTSSSPDTLKNTQIYRVDIVADSADAEKSTYKEGVDFKLQNGNQIVWGVTEGSKAPASGTTYYVTYVYTKTLAKGTDYQIITEGEEELQVTKISFVGMKGLKPVENSLVDVDYEYFLAREDMVTLDKNGNYKIITGQPAPLSSVVPPQQQDPLTLRLGYILVFPNSKKATVEKNTVTRIPFTGLQNLAERVANNESNFAVLELRNQAMQNEDPVTLSDTVSDNFLSLSKADITNDDFDVTYDLSKDKQNGIITTPPIAKQPVRPEYSAADSSIHVFKDMVTAPFREESIISQPLATGVININPYDVYQSFGTMRISPSADSWVDTSFHTIFNEVHINVGSSRYLTNGPVQPGPLTPDTSAYFPDLGVSVDNIKFIQAGGVEMHESQGSSNSVVSLIDYARPRNIKFSAANLQPGTDNLQITMDGKKMKATPASGFTEGSNEGTVRADTQGMVQGTFRLPANTIRTGTREVRLTNERNTASSSYYSHGTQIDMYKAITRTSVAMALIDPLAQTFTVEEDRVLSSVDLYFSTKPSEDGLDSDGHKTSVIVQLRGVSESGLPTSTVYAERTLKPSEISTSKTGSVATHVMFDNPVLAEASQSFALVLMTDSDKYNVFYAKNGNKRLDNKALLNQQAYKDGVMLTSSNAQTWTPDQWSDLTFKVNSAIFNTTGSVVFQTIYPKNSFFLDDEGNPMVDDSGEKIAMTADKLTLLSSYLTPDNTGLSWDIKLVTDNEPDSITVSDVEWQPITNLVDVDLNAYAREIKLRATFTAKPEMSPILTTDDLSLMTYLAAKKGAYISRNVDMTNAPFNTIKAEMEVSSPIGSSVTLYYSVDGGSTWIKFTSADEDKNIQVDREYRRITYKKILHNQSAGDNKLENKIKYYIELGSDAGFVKPKVRRLMTTMHKESGEDGTQA